MGQRATLFGNGAVGRALARRLAAQGWSLRIAQRTLRTSEFSGEFRSTDLMNRDAVLSACADADVVVCCSNFPYRSGVWARHWPKAMAHLLEGCERAGARFVFADNLYMYGPQTAPLREDMPLTEHGRKPWVRALVTGMWMKAHAEGRVMATSVRASDFYGPQSATSFLSEYGVKAIMHGKAALAPFVSIDHPHHFTYVPDFARALDTLIHAPDDAYGRAWHVPNAPARSYREILNMVAEMTWARLRINDPAPWIKRLAGVFVADMRELEEMSFQWDRPYLVDSSAFGTRFWADATPLEEGLQATIAWYGGPDLRREPG